MLALLGMVKMTGLFHIFPPHLHKKVTRIKFYFFLVLLVNLPKRTGEERQRQTSCDKRDNNFV